VDRDELQGSMQSSQYANRAEVSEADTQLVVSPTGQEDKLGVEGRSLAQPHIGKPAGAKPRSAANARRQPGMNANETIDGPGGTEEALASLLRTRHR